MSYAAYWHNFNFVFNILGEVFFVIDFCVLLADVKYPHSFLASSVYALFNRAISDCNDFILLSI